MTDRMVRHEVIKGARDFQQMGLLPEDDRVLLHSRLEADSARNAWYEISLIAIQDGYLIEAHAGDRSRRSKEIWFRPKLEEAQKKYSRILNDKVNPARRSPRKYKLVKEVSHLGNYRHPQISASPCQQQLQLVIWR